MDFRNSLLSETNKIPSIDGFPEPLIIQILQNSNGLEALNAMLLATVVNSSDMIQKVLSLQYLYIDSLPMHIPEIMDKFYNIRYP